MNNALVAQLVKGNQETLPAVTGATVPTSGKAVSPKLLSRQAARLGERPRETGKVVGSNPPQCATLPGHAKRPVRPFQFRWREPLGNLECPYARRTFLNLGLFSIRLHEWYRSDDKRNMHDHPWHFATIVLRGSYVDVSATGRDRLTVGSVRFRKATHTHYVEAPETGALTLIVTTHKLREWGFWVKGAFKRPLRYFSKYGHPPCTEQ